MKARIILKIWTLLLPGIFVAVQQYLDGKAPAEVVGCITYGIAVLGFWGLSKWLGKDVVNFQEYLRSLGFYEGTPSGIFGPRTTDGAKEAINDDDVYAQGPPGKIVVKKAKPVQEPTVARPPWSKMH